MADGGIVAILFTDLVGSTTLYDRLGDVEAESLRRDHFAVLRQEISRHGGSEVKNAGDGLMVVFQSAVAAVEAAVDMQRACETRRRAGGDDPLDLRVGIHVGEPLRDEADYFGISVNTARRLCDRAEHNQILVSSLVRALAAPRNGCSMDPVGALDLKGLSDPVEAFAVGWHRDDQPDAALPRTLSVDETLPFVGRSTEIELLTLAWKRVVAGDRRCVLVSGEPGIGKTRLVSEVARNASMAGVVLAGGSDPELVTAYQPWLEALEPHVRAPGTAVAALLDSWPDLRALFPHLEASPSTGDDGRSERVVAGLIELVERIADGRPVMVVLDDAHWADDATLLLVRRLMAAAVPGRVLLVLTYRDTELRRTHPLTALLADLRTRPEVERIALRGLTPADVATILGDGVDGDNDADSEVVALAARIEAESEGNPFFVRELILHLAESGKITLRNGRWELDEPLGAIGVPEGVRDVVGRRLSRLSQPCNDVLTTAAVIGRSFTLPLLSSLTDRRPLELLEVIEEAVEAGLVTGDTDRADGFLFSHAIVRETLYSELSTSTRLRLHARVADALQTRRAKPAEIAHHLLEAGPAVDGTQAAAWALLAAHIAFNLLGADVDAAALAARGLEALGPDDASWLAVELLTIRADGLYGSQRFDEGDDACRRAIELARRIGDGNRYAHAVTVFGRSYGNKVDTTEIDLAIAALPANTSPIAELRLRTAIALGVHRDLGESQTLLESALEVGDVESITYASLGVADALVAAGRYQEIVDVLRTHFESALRWQQFTQLPFGNRLVFAHLALGDRSEAERLIRQVVEGPFSSLAGPTSEWAMYAAVLAFLDGRLGDAERRAQIVAAADGDHFRGAAPLLAGVARERGLSGDVLPLLEGAANGEPAWMAGIAAFAADIGDHQKARDAASGVVAAADDDIFRSTALALLADAAWLMRDAELAGEVAHALECFRGFGIVARHFLAMGAADRYLGLCEATLGDWERAERSLRAAIEFNDRSRARLWAAYARAELAGVLAERGQRGEAVQLARVAADVASELDLARLGARAGAVLAGAD